MSSTWVWACVRTCASTSREAKWFRVALQSWPGIGGGFHTRFSGGRAQAKPHHNSPESPVAGFVPSPLVRYSVASWRETSAQQLVPTVEEATAPFQHALTTHSGCACVAHAVQALTDVDESGTVLSIDGTGSFDFVSRGAMLEGLRQSTVKGSHATQVPILKTRLKSVTPQEVEAHEASSHVQHKMMQTLCICA